MICDGRCRMPAGLADPTPHSARVAIAKSSIVDRAMIDMSCGSRETSTNQSYLSVHNHQGGIHPALDQVLTWPLVSEELFKVDARVTRHTAQPGARCLAPRLRRCLHWRRADRRHGFTLKEVGVRWSLAKKRTTISTGLIPTTCRNGCFACWRIDIMLREERLQNRPHVTQHRCFPHNNCGRVCSQCSSLFQSGVRCICTVL